MNSRDVDVGNYPIKLGQFLKLANIVSDGIEAKFLVSEGKVQVNDMLETRRGRKLYPGDRVQHGATEYHCCPRAGQQCKD